MPDNRAQVKLELVDLTQGRIQSLRRDIEALANVRASSASSAGDRDQARALAAQGAALKDAERGWRGVNAEAGKAKATISGLASASGAARGFVGSAAGSAGLGTLGSLLTIGSIGAAVAAAGAIAGQSVRMAYEFEKASTRAAQALGMGTGPNLQANITAIQTAARAGLAYNIARPEMAAAMSTYGKTSGAGVAGVTQAAGGIAMYSRAYGMDPTLVASLMGRASGLDGRSFGEDAAGAFGAAENAGNFGRRTEEFITTATSVLAQMQASNARGNYGMSDAAGMLANVSRGQSGFFGTAAGAQAFFSAGKGLVGALSGSPQGMALGVSAGIAPIDVMLGRGGRENEEKLMRYVGQVTGGGGSGFTVASMLQRFNVPQDAIRNFEDRMGYDKNGVLHGDYDAKVRGLYEPHAYAAHEAVVAKAKADAYKDTELGHYEALFTNIQEHELELGQTILHKLEGSATALNEILNGQYLKGITDLIGSNKVLVAALVGTAIAQAGGVGALRGLLGGAARMLPGLGAAAASVGEGAVGFGLGGVALMTGGFMLANTHAAGEEGALDGTPLDYWVKYGRRHGTGALPQNVLAEMRGMASRNALAEAISGPETGHGADVHDSAAGALGRYQILPSTAAPYLHDILAHRGHGMDSPAYYDGTTLSAAGRALVRNSPQIQLGLTSAYIVHLQQVAVAKHLNPNDPRLIAGAYYAGEAHMGDWNWVAGQDQPGNTNHLTEREYAAQVAPGFAEAMKHLSITDSHGERLDLQLTAKVISHRKPGTQSRIKTRSSGR